MKSITPIPIKIILEKTGPLQAKNVMKLRKMAWIAGDFFFFFVRKLQNRSIHGARRGTGMIH
jgi:hypothetical protein